MTEYCLCEACAEGDRRGTGLPAYPPTKPADLRRANGELPRVDADIIELGGGRWGVRVMTKTRYCDTFEAAVKVADDLVANLVGPDRVWGDLAIKEKGP